ncbi:MAG: acyl-CoA thioesterase [Nitrososphaerales archaeon]
MSEPVPNPVRVAIQIRWRDLDALAHVNNAVFITYFEYARLAYMRELLGPDAPLDPQTMLPVDFQFILAEVRCQYRSPVTLEDRPVIEVWVSQVGRKSFVFEYRMTDEKSGRLLAEGCSTQVWYDYRTEMSQVIPEAIIGRIEIWQGAKVQRA